MVHIVVSSAFQGWNYIIRNSFHLQWNIDVQCLLVKDVAISRHVFTTHVSIFHAYSLYHYRLRAVHASDTNYCHTWQLFLSARFKRKGNSLDNLRQALHLSSYTTYKFFMSVKSILKPWINTNYTVHSVITSIFVFATTSQDLCNSSYPHKFDPRCTPLAPMLVERDVLLTVHRNISV
jgi:hypothetical protein